MKQYKFNFQNHIENIEMICEYLNMRIQNTDNYFLVRFHCLLFERFSYLNKSKYSIYDEINIFFFLFLQFLLFLINHNFNDMWLFSFFMKFK